MKIKLLALLTIITVIGSMAFAQDLKIDMQVKVGSDDAGNYFTFAGPIRYLSADKDQADAKTGASMKNSTELFQGYKFDVKGKSVMPDGLRGLFLYGVAMLKAQKDDSLTVAKAGNGVITIQYVHRGTAYMIVTDAAGKTSINKGVFKKRAVGYIKGEGPQVIHTDFSADGTAAKIDWKKAWDEKIADGKEYGGDIKVKTGKVINDSVSPEAMYVWDGELQFTYDKNILKIIGGLTAVKK